MACLLDTVRYLDNLGVPAIRVIRTAEAPRWLEVGGAAALDYDEFFDSMLDFMRKFTAEDHHINVDIWSFVRLWPQAKRYSLVPIRPDCEKSDEEIYGCPDCRTSFMVGANGEVAPRDALPGFLAQNSISY